MILIHRGILSLARKYHPCYTTFSVHISCVPILHSESFPLWYTTLYHIYVICQTQLYSRICILSHHTTSYTKVYIYIQRNTMYPLRISWLYMNYAHARVKHHSPRYILEGKCLSSHTAPPDGKECIPCHHLLYCGHRGCRECRSLANCASLSCAYRLIYSVFNTRSIRPDKPSSSTALYTNYTHNLE